MELQYLTISTKDKIIAVGLMTHTMSLRYTQHITYQLNSYPDINILSTVVYLTDVDIEHSRCTFMLEGNPVTINAENYLETIDDVYEHMKKVVSRVEKIVTEVDIPVNKEKLGFFTVKVKDAPSFSFLVPSMHYFTAGTLFILSQYKQKQGIEYDWDEAELEDLDSNTRQYKVSVKGKIFTVKEEDCITHFPDISDYLGNKVTALVEGLSPTSNIYGTNSMQLFGELSTIAPSEEEGDDLEEDVVGAIITANALPKAPLVLLQSAENVQKINGLIMSTLRELGVGTSFRSDPAIYEAVNTQGQYYYMYRTIEGQEGNMAGVFFIADSLPDVAIIAILKQAILSKIISE